MANLSTQESEYQRRFNRGLTQSRLNDPSPSPEQEQEESAKNKKESSDDLLQKLAGDPGMKAGALTQYGGAWGAMRAAQGSFIQTLAFFLKELGKKILAADWGLTLFLGLNLQFFLFLAGKPLKKVPMKIWEIGLIILVDILLFFLIIGIAGLIMGILVYFKEKPTEAMFNFIFGPFNAIKDLIPSL